MSSDIPSIYNPLPENNIIIAGPTRHVLKFIGLYDSIIDEQAPRCLNSSIILFFMQLFHISAIVTLASQPNFRDMTFSIPTFIPLIFFMTYLLWFYFPCWSKSQNLRRLLRNITLSQKFNRYMIIFLFIELLVCVPLYVVFLIYNPESYKFNINTSVDIFVKIFNILLIPYGIIAHTYMALLFCTLITFSDFTCNSIEQYSDKIKNKLKQLDTPILEDDQVIIETWCQSSYDLIGKPVGMIISICGICIITGIFMLLLFNQNITVVIIDTIAIIIYGTLVDFILWICSRWHYKFNECFGEWKNNINYIPAINKYFSNIISFNHWLDDHESHSFRLFGRNGLKVNHDFVLKLKSFTFSLIAFVATKLYEDYMKSN